MRDLIKRPIGAGLDNDPDDIRIVRGTLKAVNGDEIDPETLSGFIDDDLDTDIRDFQQNAGLIEDGRLTPGGETERNLISRITGEGTDVATHADTVLQASVGEGGENDAADVIAAKRALGTLGYLKYDRTAPPSPFIDAQTVAALTKFQNDTKLFPDGRANPDGGTIEALRELLEEKSNRPGSDETEVAVGPALIPLFMLLARTAPHLAKFARGAAAAGAVGNAARQAGDQTLQRPGEADTEQNFRGDRSEGIKLEHIPPDPSQFGSGTEFPAEDPEGYDGKHEGQPTEPFTHIPAGFPIPDNPEDLVTLLPGNTDQPQLPLLIERRGKESTRAFNAGVTRAFEAVGKKIGLKIKHIGGSRDPDGREIPETHFKNRDTGGLKGGSFSDMTFLISGKQDILVVVNTVDTRADGMTPTTREENNAIKLDYNMKANAVLITLPKAGPDQTIDFAEFERRTLPIFKDVKKIADGKSARDALGRRIKLHEKLPTK